MSNEDLGQQVLERVGAWKPEKAPVQVAYLGEGDFCTAFILDHHLIARVGKHAEADEALGREASLLTPLARFLTLPIPTPTLLPDRTLDGHVIAVHEQITGIEVGPASWSAMPEAARSLCAQELGAFLSQLHAIDPEMARSWGAATLDHVAEARVFRDKIGRLGGSVLGPGLARRTDAVLARYEAGGEFWSYQPALVHADLSPGHVLVKPGEAGLAGVIDWGDARIADPARDFVYLYEDWGTPFLDAVLANYAHEGPGRLVPRIHLHFVIVHVDWMMEAACATTRADLRAAASTLMRALADLEFDLARGLP